VDLKDSASVKSSSLEALQQENRRLSQQLDDQQQQQNQDFKQVQLLLITSSR